MTELLVITVMGTGAAFGWPLTRYLRADLELRRSIRQVWRIRITWRRLARVLGLTYRDPTPRYAAWIWRRTDPKQDEPRIVVPRIRIRADEFGVIVRARPLPRIGLEDWQKVAQSLADAWHATRVSITRDRAGMLTIRAVRRDPLTMPLLGASPGRRPGRLTVWPLGIDEFARNVRVPLTDVAGIVVSGIPGSGKTSLLNGLLARYLPTPCAQFIVADGKGGDDYSDLRPRLSAYVDDDIAAAHDLFRRLDELRRGRTAMVRAHLGVRNYWHAEPTPDWPVIVIILDEVHTYFQEPRGRDKATQDIAAMAAENRRLIEQLVKKGRSAGLLTILATQRATGDSIPTSIRDVCAIALSFAQTTQAASVAALGEQIKDHPDADPMGLQGREYVGVCSMRIEGQPGFTRVRTPLTQLDSLEQLAEKYAPLTRSLRNLTPSPVHLVPDDTDERAEAVA